MPALMRLSRRARPHGDTCVHVERKGVLECFCITHLCNASCLPDAHLRAHDDVGRMRLYGRRCVVHFECVLHYGCAPYRTMLCALARAVVSERSLTRMFRHMHAHVDHAAAGQMYQVH